MDTIIKRKYWGPFFTLIISFIVFCIFSIIQMIVILCYNEFESPPEDLIKSLSYAHLGVISSVSSIIGISIIIFFIKLRKTSLKDYLHLHLPKLKITIIFVFISFLLMFFSEFISNLFPNLFEDDFVVESYQQANNLPMLYLGVVFLGPIFEEVLFRGFLFKGLEQTSLGGHGAVFLTSIIFAIIHVQYGLPIILVMLLPMAILLGYARLKSNSLLLPILLHSINNLVACLITHFQIY